MTEYGTIKIPREEYERHNERRKDQNLEWVEYLDGQAPDDPTEEIAEEIEGLRNDVEDVPDEIRNGSENGSIDPEKLAERRQAQLEEVVGGICGDHATEESIGELADEIRKLQEIVERVPDDTADKVIQKHSGGY